jgi:hypothetical protein
MPRTKAPKKPPVKPRQLRLNDDDMETIAILAKRWGGAVKPLDRTSVVREALRRARVAEDGTESRSTKR